VAAVVTIRPASTDDAGPVARIRAESWQAAYAGIMPAGFLARVTGPDEVARRASELAVQPLPVTPADGGKAELYAIYVRPQAWSTGAGRSLLAAVIERVSALRYATLSLWVLEANARARRFYQRAGFAPSGESKSEDRFGGVTEVRYARLLG
jgi:GNAT superfamily N-acetyltransferase